MFAPVHFLEKLDDFSEFVHEGGFFECMLCLLRLSPKHTFSFGYVSWVVDRFGTESNEERVSLKKLAEVDCDKRCRML